MTIELWSQKFYIVASFELGIGQRFKQIHCFFLPFNKSSLEDSTARTSQPINILRWNLYHHFSFCFVFCFYVETLEYTKICWNDGYTIIFIFLNQKQYLFGNIFLTLSSQYLVIAGQPFTGPENIHNGAQARLELYLVAVTKGYQVLHCTALTLQCTVLQCTVLHSIALPCTAGSAPLAKDAYKCAQ